MQQTLNLFEREMVRHPLERRTLTVSVVRDIGPAMRRLTLVGPALAGFASDGPEDHVKAFFPEPGSPQQGDPASARTLMRDFTPSRYRPASDGGELDIDVVLHGASAPASAWATTAAPGTTLSIGGPKGSRRPPRDIGSALLVADATALPALARWVRMLPSSVAVTAVVVSEGDELDPYLDEELPSSVAVHRVRGADPTTRDQALVEVVRGIPIATDTFVWAAGEATALIPVRRHFRRERGLPAQQVKVDGYWKRGVIALDHHAPLDETDPD